MAEYSNGSIGDVELPPGVKLIRDVSGAPIIGASADDPTQTESQGGTFIDVEDDQQQLPRLYAELGEGITGEPQVKAYRVRPDNRKLAYLCTYAYHEFINGGTDKVRDKYGGGEYEFRVYGTKKVQQPDGTITDRFGCLHLSRQFIEQPIVPEVPAAAAIDTGVITTLKTMMEQQQQFMRELALAMRAPTAPAPSASITELVNALGALDNMRGGRQSASNSDPIIMFDRAASVLAKLKSAADGTPTGANTMDVLLEVVRSFVPVLAENVAKLPVVQHAAAAAINPPAEAPAALPAPVQDARSPLEPANNATAANGDPMNMILSGYVKLLVGAAQNNQDVNQVADMIYDQVPDDALDKFVLDPNWLNALAGIDERVRSFQPYFERLRNRIIELTKEEPAD